ncbi:hypothetical protein [Mycolicibacterium sp. PDY-3]|uniref:hypothetical protein n=1 Tax=Mycolicibacterium sp. PDY-3 TaxID=3376069 RepID=UPI0037A4442B
MFIDRGLNRCETGLPKLFGQEPDATEALAFIFRRASGGSLAIRGLSGSARESMCLRLHGICCANDAYALQFSAPGDCRRRQYRQMAEELMATMYEPGNAGRRRNGKHRRAENFAVRRWLMLGAASAGVGAALVLGPQAGLAVADDGGSSASSDTGSSASSDTGSSTGPERSGSTDSGSVSTGPKKADAANDSVTGSADNAVRNDRTGGATSGTDKDSDSKDSDAIDPAKSEDASTISTGADSGGANTDTSGSTRSETPSSRPEVVLDTHDVRDSDTPTIKATERIAAVTTMSAPQAAAQTEDATLTAQNDGLTQPNIVVADTVISPSAALAVIPNLPPFYPRLSKTS